MLSSVYWTVVPKSSPRKLSMLVQTCNASTWAPEAKGVFKAPKTVLQRGTGGGGKVGKEKNMQKKFG